jgi:hypothetical protein
MGVGVGIPRIKRCGSGNGIVIVVVEEFIALTAFVLQRILRRGIVWLSVRVSVGRGAGGFGSILILLSLPALRLGLLQLLERDSFGLTPLKVLLFVFTGEQLRWCSKPSLVFTHVADPLVLRLAKTGRVVEVLNLLLLLAVPRLLVQNLFLARSRLWWWLHSKERKQSAAEQ